MKTLRTRWWPYLGKVERGWVVFCTTSTFLLLLYQVITQGHP